MASDETGSARQHDVLRLVVVFEHHFPVGHDTS